MKTKLVEPIKTKQNLKYNHRDIQGVIPSIKLTCDMKTRKLGVLKILNMIIRNKTTQLIKYVECRISTGEIKLSKWAVRL